MLKLRSWKPGNQCPQKSHPRRCSTRGAAAKVEADAAERDATKEVEVPVFFGGKSPWIFGGKKAPIVLLKDTKCLKIPK